ncbi:alpha/beta hydrolase [Nocardioides ginsengisoli]|uniref:Alpha/beta hydrolase n=1 Tax=Nocardioides ginsengisoli TaxID=363868 RepID=A0ABW3W6W1_9ACTN
MAGRGRPPRRRGRAGAAAPQRRPVRPRATRRPVDSSRASPSLPRDACEQLRERRRCLGGTAAAPVESPPRRRARSGDRASPAGGRWWWRDPPAASSGRCRQSAADPGLPGSTHFHGGGMVIGSTDDFDILARLLAEASGAVVVSVDYRLAPEHPYPTATDEAYFATQWLAASAAELGIDPERIAVAGDSAGATLAAGVALQTRDEDGVPLAFQLHIYAGIDRDDTRPSVLEFADGPIITAGDFAWAKNHYLGDAIVVTASHDPSRDGAEEYGLRLRDAGVQVALLRYPGVAHGFLMHADHHARARLALAEIGGLMRARLAH